MDLSEEWVGKYVAVQFARPLYMFEYGAHIKDGGGEALAPSPLREEAVGPEGQKAARLVSRDFAIGRVVDASYNLVLELTVPNHDQQSVTLMRKTIWHELVVAVDVVGQHEAPIPQAVRHQRERPAAGAQPKIIL